MLHKRDTTSKSVISQNIKSKAIALKRNSELFLLLCKDERTNRVFVLFDIVTGSEQSKWENQLRTKQFQVVSG